MYETNQTDVTNALTTASPEVFNSATIDSIMSLVISGGDTVIAAEQVAATDNQIVTVAPGTELAFVTVSDLTVTNVTVASDIPVVLFQGAAGVNATFNVPVPTAGQDLSASAVQGAPGDPIERFIAGTAGNDNITILDAMATQVVAGNGDTINAGTGFTIVTAAQGSSIVAGGGDTIIATAGTDEDFTITEGTGTVAIVNNTSGLAVDISNVQYVQLDGGDALIFADDMAQATVANLYQALFGRTADAGGLEYWFDQADAGVWIGQIGNFFTTSAEYTGGGLTNEQFVESLYLNGLGRAADAGGLTYWSSLLNTAAATRGEVAAGIAMAAADPASGEVNVIGSVTVVEGIDLG
ncbi:DUF4214 domain-containing protein [Massilia sp. METH4]|uniref:DUF4214 domain-containing protein n=1 Tax=Massilia sp. METH4 TaxID=3123041 RepID=UPI0030CD31BF